MAGRSCMRQQCSCALMAMVLLAAAIRGAHGIKTRVWTNATDKDFVYPEQDLGSDFGIDMLVDKPSLGIAVSGGGWRAASLAYGWLRALHLVGAVYSSIAATGLCL